MSVTATTMTAAELAAYIQTIPTFTTLEEAISFGFHIIETGDPVGTALATIGGAGVGTVGTGTALDIAAIGGLGASGARVSTSAITLLRTSAGYRAAGLLSMEMGAVAAAAAPALGIALGAGLYSANPRLWTKISEFLLPYCYPGTTQIPTIMDLIAETNTYKLLVKLGLVEGLKDLFIEEGILSSVTTGSSDAAQVAYYGHSFSLPGVQSWTVDGYTYEIIAGTAWFVASSGAARHGMMLISDTLQDVTMRVSHVGGYVSEQTKTLSRSLIQRLGIYYYKWPSSISGYTEEYAASPSGTYSAAEIADVFFYGNQSGGTGQMQPGVSPWAGEPAPAEPPEWPSTVPKVVPSTTPGEEPTIIPFPLTPVTPPTVPDYPVIDPDVPIIPFPQPEPEPVPYEPPPEWPEEDPWPVVIPFPWEPTVPNPQPPWPEVIPWPLPPEEPDDWPKIPEEWPFEVPDDWPEFPHRRSWPTTPDEWPEEIPWPEAPEIKPEDWPEELPWPWPESPSEWPEEIPWPVPWPEEWPVTEPWPVEWPKEIPYPKFPQPQPSPDPEVDPEPGQITEPGRQIDPYIIPQPVPWEEPWPFEPAPTPSPSEDPTQPSQPTQPSDPPVQPTEPPPSGISPITPIPIIPLPFSNATGLISVYNPTQIELLAFAQWLWVTWQDATIDKIWNNPFDGVITLFELYCTPTIDGRKSIRSGFLDSGIAADTVSRYTEINCGSIGVPEYYGNYLDYSPYSKAFIYLPFIGVVEVSVDDIVGHGVNITYRIDEYNGSCIAMITVAKITEVNGEEVEYSNLLYQFSGNCAVELPLSGGSQASIRAGMMQAAAYGLSGVIGGIAGLLGGSIGSAVSSITGGAAAAVGSLVSAKSSVQHSGSFGASYGAMGCKIPYITVIRPKQIQVPNYNLLYGYQAHKAVNIGQCSGYIRCREVHVNSSTASNEEKALIEQLLKEGVYVTE